MADSDYLRNDAQLPTIKKVLKKEFGIETSTLLDRVEAAEEKAANTTTVSLSLPTASLTKLQGILVADGVITAAANATTTNYAEWLDTQIETVYAQYLSDGKIKTTDDTQTT